jgi:hypothetical protein
LTKICLISGNYLEAKRWAFEQQLDDGCWFYPTDIEELTKLSNFYVFVVGTAGENVPPAYFERIFQLAKQRGRINRL